MSEVKKLDQLKQSKAEKEKRIEELKKLKAAGGAGWNTTLQKELEKLVIEVADLDESIAAGGVEETTEAATKTTKTVNYVVPAGSENSVHLMIVQGDRFSPKTGKEIRKAHAQVFTYSEWQNFKKYFKGLGYSIIQVLHDPYNEAQEFVEKED